MLNLQERIDLMIRLGRFLLEESPTLNKAIQEAYFHNNWFTIENSRKAIEAIGRQMLQADQLHQWVKGYPVQEAGSNKSVGIVMAGNLPLVGFHDFLCVFIAGFKAKIKLSDKDKKLPMAIFDFLLAEEPQFKAHLELVPMLRNFDAVIATGSNNTSRYFENYFGKYPNIIRKNRTSVAVLNGKESKAELLELGKDIFDYFGLGCRNVSKLYLPKGYAMEPLLETLNEFNTLALHNKYKNNYDYNLTLFILNKIPYWSNGCLMMAEQKDLFSRIACVNFEYYNTSEELDETLNEVKDQIQVIVSQANLENWSSLAPGQAQQPGLLDYADGVDTMEFLTTL
ncbi:MAG: acyl-CoA reductase [Bacteroidota bacterium]